VLFTAIVVIFSIKSLRINYKLSSQTLLCQPQFIPVITMVFTGFSTVLAKILFCHGKNPILGKLITWTEMPWQEVAPT